MSFALDVAAFVKKTKKNNETVMRAVTLKLFSAIIYGSPVDTGRFRMNWQVAGSTPPVSSLLGEDKTGNEATARVTQFVSSTSEWHEMTLTNNLVYAPIIEYGGYKADFGVSSSVGPRKNANGGKTVNGYSKQAPQGVVRVNVKRFQQLLDEEAAKVR